MRLLFHFPYSFWVVSWCCIILLACMQLHRAQYRWSGTAVGSARSAVYAHAT